ncbi:MAG: hypothetical protein ACRD3G_13960 [Vicinamibacterales bacterium]|jgi:hypothetical protein
MGVIIDDFEVVAERQSPPGEAPAPPPPTPSSAGGPNPEDVRYIVRTREQREARLFAH